MLIIHRKRALDFSHSNCQNRVNIMGIEHLTPEQKINRRRILEISYTKRLPHLSSCLTAIDLIDAVYRVKEANDKFVLSNGHAGVALYVVLEQAGFLESSKIYDLYVHPDRNPTIGIDASTGSLGQGLPIALGFALADRRRNVYCTISDGECSEGSIWEALRIAEDQEVNNLKILVNANKWSGYDPISLPTLERRLRGFSSQFISVPGHRLEEIMKALQMPSYGGPSVILAATEVEQFPFLKGFDAHYHIMNSEEYEQAMEVLK